MEAVRQMTNWDVEKIRKDFPVLSQTVNGKPLVYLDGQASSQVPQSVIDRGAKYLAEDRLRHLRRSAVVEIDQRLTVHRLRHRKILF